MNHYTTIFYGKNVTELNSVELYAHLFSPILIPGCSKNTIASLHRPKRKMRQNEFKYKLLNVINENKIK